MPENPRSEEAAAGGDEASRGGTVRRRWVYSPVRFLWFVAVAPALALAVAVTALELGAIVPGLGLFSAIGSFIMPILAASLRDGTTNGRVYSPMRSAITSICRPKNSALASITLLNWPESSKLTMPNS
jgi:hypothetical protein